MSTTTGDDRPHPGATLDLSADAEHTVAKVKAALGAERAGRRALRWSLSANAEGTEWQLTSVEEARRSPALATDGDGRPWALTVVLEAPDFDFAKYYVDVMRGFRDAVNGWDAAEDPEGRHFAVDRRDPHGEPAGPHPSREAALGEAARRNGRREAPVSPLIDRATVDAAFREIESTPMSLPVDRVVDAEDGRTVHMVSQDGTILGMMPKEVWQDIVKGMTPRQGGGRREEPRPAVWALEVGGTVAQTAVSRRRLGRHREEARREVPYVSSDDVLSLAGELGGEAGEALRDLVERATAGGRP